METLENEGNIIDVRKISPQEKHGKIFESFRKIRPGEELQVIADHEPRHLLDHMIHEGLPVVESEYRSRINGDGTFSGFFRKENAGVPASGVKITSFDTERSYLEHKFNPVGIYSGKNYKVVLTYLKAGQYIPVHSPSTDLIFAVFKGTGTGIFADHEELLAPGKVIIIPGGEKRGIRALTDLEGLHIVSPIPEEQEHAEVVQKLSSGRFQ